MNQPFSIPLEEFLRPFFEPNETVRFRILDDRKTGEFRGLKPQTTLAQVNNLIGLLKEHNAQNHGLFFVVNHGGHDDGDITRVNAQFVECDNMSFSDQWDQFMAFPLEPSIIVKTQKSLHTYWLMKDGADVADFRSIQQRLVQHFDGDPMCVNPSRVMRLPGFYHCKGEPVMVECVKFNPELRYAQEELAALLPALSDAPAEAHPIPKGDAKGLAVMERRCLFIQHCREHAAELPEHDWYAMITNLAVFEGGEKRIHELSAQYPKYRKGETQEKINHYLRSATKPITCKTIAEKGFICPRVASGECGCKAPAALRFRPLDIETLRAFLAELPVTHTATDDVQAAQAFIRDYLYNVDSILAAAFIGAEIKAHFAFKAGAIKLLETMQRELFRAHQANTEAKREASGLDLPEWYEFTARGGLRFLPGILANHMAETVEAFYGAGAFHGYDGGVYTAHEDLWASATARAFMIPRHATLNAITDTIGQWKMLIRKPVREINSNPFTINVKNGLYNVLNGSFKEHTPAYCSTVQISAEYREDATCPHFRAFLQGILAEPEIALMQEIMGYLLIPVNKAQKSFVFVGAPNAGKSTLLSVAQEILLGSDNVSNIPWQSLGDRFNKAELFGKLANIFADLPSKSIDDNGLFKALTGEDYITAERKNKDPFSFRPYARLLFSCNDVPRNYGDRSDGFYRRLIIVRFDRSVPKERRDPNLREKLTLERDGILLWALEGLRRLIAQNYVFSETDATRAELQRYKVESNSALSFLEECCVVEADAECAREDAFNAYREFCSKNGYKAMSQTTFNREVENFDTVITRGKDRVGKRRTWRGLKLNDLG